MNSQLSLEYYQPMLEPNQTSRLLSLNLIDTKPYEAGFSDYNMRDYGATVQYGFPVFSQNNRFTLGASFDYIKIGKYEPGRTRDF